MMAKIYKLFKLLLLGIPLLYFYCDKKLTILISVIFLLPAFILVRERKARITKFLFLVAGIFIIILNFEKDIAIFSIVVALIYGFISSLFMLGGKLKFRGKTIEGLLAAAIFAYLIGSFTGNILGLDKNIIVAGCISAPFIELFIRWPDEEFTIPFFIALVAQFVKNSF